MTPPQELLERFARHDRRALAEILSLVEAGNAPPLPVEEKGDGSRLFARGRDVAPSRSINDSRPLFRSVGITGSGGAGKSTLIGALIAHLRKLGLSVGVLASDPQSPVTGGALLGDRIRVGFDPADDGVYFRSLSTRGAQGGISAATGAARDWLLAFGFDVVLVETVGVGQDQIAVRDVVETLVLLVTPNTGDEVQWEKAGLIEVADLVVVNKSDLPGADRVRQQLVSALALGGTSKAVPVLNITAASGAGVAELWDAIAGGAAGSK